MTRRAKIVCTLGPVTSSLEQVTALVEAGVDVARLNFSHGAHADHAAAYEVGRQAPHPPRRAGAGLPRPPGPQNPLRPLPPGPGGWGARRPGSGPPPGGAGPGRP